MPKPNDSTIEVAKINARALVITAVISATSGFAVAALALVDVNSGDQATSASEPAVFRETSSLPPNSCITDSGEVGQVRVTTAIFNRLDGSLHGFPQVHVKEPGEYGISNDTISELRSEPGNYLTRRWGAMWECVE